MGTQATAVMNHECGVGEVQLRAHELAQVIDAGTHWVARGVDLVAYGVEHGCSLGV